MSFSTKPHTTIHFKRNGVMESMGRAGHLPARSNTGPSVESALGGRVSGVVAVRHRDGGMFGKPGRVVASFEHEVK